MNPSTKVQDQIRAALSQLWPCEVYNLQNRPKVRAALDYLREVLKTSPVNIKPYRVGLGFEMRLVKEEAEGFYGCGPHEPHVMHALCVQRCLEALLSPYGSDSEGLAHSALAFCPGLAVDLNKMCPRTRST